MQATPDCECVSDEVDVTRYRAYRPGMNRRRFLLTSLTGALTAPLTAGMQQPEAQQAGKVYQVAWLSGSSPGNLPVGVADAFQQGLKERGWVEDKNVRIVYRYAGGVFDRLPGMAAELVRMRVDVIVATTPAALAVARKATSAIPIVMVYGPDPVDFGVVTSLARPGGNVTGLTSLSADLGLKQLELLKAIVPELARVAVLFNPANPWHPTAVKRIEAGARTMRLHCQLVSIREPAEFDTAFGAMSMGKSNGVLNLADPMTFTHRARLADLAVQHRLPTMNGVIGYTEAGGLASYWPNDAEMFRRTAAYVDRLLRGSRPGDLPIEQPTKFELVINLKTAKALGLTIPPSLLARADHLIE
jgi:putative ABC transport system substrate-binding protein